jgi:hypothetical protein
MANLRMVDHSELRSRLREGVVQFAFKKIDGSLRTAVGTTQLSSIPAEHWPKGSRESSPLQVPYWDVEKGEWRSVSTSREVFI